MSSRKPKIIFFGTPEFARTILSMLIENDYIPIAVVTAPDKPVGSHAYRQAGKRILTPPPVKVLAEKNKIPVFQPEKIENWSLSRLKSGSRQESGKIENLKPDLIVLVAYGQIIPKEMLKIPKYGALNVHPSLLPKYRGASPIQAAILAGDKETGVTIILMDEKMDHGPIITNYKLQITKYKITTAELSEQLAKLGGNLLTETLPKWLDGKIKPRAQDHSQATFCWQIKKEDGHVDWAKSAQEIERMCRAYFPWPGAYAKLKTKNVHQRRISLGLKKLKTVKIIGAEVLETEHHKKPGTAFLTENKQLAVACGQNALILEKVQPEGKRIMTGQEFLNGHPEIISTVLK